MPIEHLLKIASDENTSSEELANIYKIYNDARLNKVIASNPNTSIELLWKLALYYPDEVLKNPILLLIAIENPNFINSISIKVLQSFLLPRRVCPKWFTVLAFKNRAGAVLKPTVTWNKNPYLNWNQLRKDFPEVKIDLSAKLFQERNFRGINLKRTNMNLVQFNGCCLSKADLSNCDLSGARFIDCILKEVDFRNSDLTRTIFKGCTLRKAIFSSNSLDCTNFECCDLRASNIYKFVFGALGSKEKLLQCTNAFVH